MGLLPTVARHSHNPGRDVAASRQYSLSGGSLKCPQVTDSRAPRADDRTPIRSGRRRPSNKGTPISHLSASDPTT
jgi:hypothetical protein